MTTLPVESAPETVALRDARFFQGMVERAPDLVLVLSDSGLIDYISPSARSVVDIRPERMRGQRLAEFIHPEDLEASQQFLARLLAEKQPVRQVLRLQSADGHWLHVEALGENCVDDPRIAGLLVFGREITDRVALEQKLNFEALHDALTGLANRVLFRDRLTQALAASSDHQDSVAVLLMDLDRFKSVNDTMGHEAGDELLRIVAQRLIRATRGSDTVARLGGDEFAVLLTGLRGRDDVVPVLRRVEAILKDAIPVGDREILTSGSIGVAFSDGSMGVTEVLRHADVAMYCAKGSGATWQFFEPEMQAVVDDRAQLEIDLRAAVANGEISLVYQPLVELTHGKAYGVEALARWDHPKRGTINPDQFIPLAEETGIIVSLGRWILNEACKTVAEWQRDGRSDSLLVSVNLASGQLMAEGCVRDVARALQDSGLTPGTLVLELTESVLLDDTSIVVERLADLKSLGVQLAIDDFGTGYSSLAYLRNFPIDILKIDRRFISDLDAGGSSSALARAVLGLGTTLSLRTVAEGIETESQLAELQAMGCSFGQGFFFATPLSAEEAKSFVRQS
jgi:diguanylate cyclase (GGDEF)-like protein/PAS domain S-box-containing protein